MADAKTFQLSIITPERVLMMNQPAEALSLPANDGKIGILAGHAPMAVALRGGIGAVTIDGQTRRFAASSGSATVMPHKVLVLLQTVEWEDEIDILRAERDKRRAQDELRQKQSHRQHQLTLGALSRAMVRLRITDRPRN